MMAAFGVCKLLLVSVGAWSDGSGWVIGVCECASGCDCGWDAEAAWRILLIKALLASVCDAGGGEAVALALRVLCRWDLGVVRVLSSSDCSSLEWCSRLVVISEGWLA